jgi:hypothetical protein
MPLMILMTWLSGRASQPGRPAQGLDISGVTETGMCCPGVFDEVRAA